MNTTLLSKHPQNSSMARDRVNGIVTGLFFIAATASAIVGLKLYDPILQNPDYLTSISANASQIVLGGIFELILVASAAGTAIMLFPYLKDFDVRFGVGYVAFRLLEVVTILVGLIAMLSVTSLGDMYLTGNTGDRSNLLAAGTALIAVHDWMFKVGPCVLLGINTFIYSYAFFQTRLVPRVLATFGIIGAVLILISGVLAMFDLVPLFSPAAIVMALPVALYEMVLAVWLIIRGFDSKKTV